jgi:hypothetical protein
MSFLQHSIQNTCRQVWFCRVLRKLGKNQLILYSLCVLHYFKLQVKKPRTLHTTQKGGRKRPYVMQEQIQMAFGAGWVHTSTRAQIQSFDSLLLHWQWYCSEVSETHSNLKTKCNEISVVSRFTANLYSFTKTISFIWQIGVHDTTRIPSYLPGRGKYWSSSNLMLS